MTDADPLPEHVEESLQAIAKLHADHRDRATPFQRRIERVTDMLAQPVCVGSLALIITIWIGMNLALIWLGRAAIDQPPFNWLQTILAVMALFMTVLILATQRRADHLATVRERLTLHLALLADQKTAKIIELIEEMRRDNPLTKNRVDEQAEAMSAPADPAAAISALEPLKEARETARDTEKRG